MKARALAGAAVNIADVPKGMKATPSPDGIGVLVSASAIENYEPIILLPEAEVIADIYRELLDGSTIGIGAGMGGLVPEKLLWVTVDAYCRTMRMRLDRWTLRLLHMVDSIRLNLEFERLKADAKK